MSDAPSLLPQKPSRRRLLGSWVVLLLGIALYLVGHLGIGSELLVQKNLDARRSDQAHNMKMARKAAERAVPDLRKGFSRNTRDWLPHYTDGVVNPLWPRVAATFAEEDDARFFHAGKRWNLVFSALFLGVVGILLGFRWSPPGILLFLLVSGLGAVLPRAAWFQPEPLYYALFFASWVTCLALLKRNPMWLYALLGFWSGMAYLSKASIQPLLLVFLIVSGVRFLGAVAPRWGRWRERGPRSGWSASKHFIGLAVFLSIHLVIISPRLGFSQERYGSPMHSFPSYWMWMDEFEECYTWMGRHDTRAELASMRAEEVPSARRWLETHDVGQGWRRLADGTWWQVRRFFKNKVTPRDKEGNLKKPWRALLAHPGWTLAGLGGMMVVALGAAVAVSRREKLPAHRQQPERGMLVFFVLSAFAGYALLHGWYTQVGDGDRFMLALWMPLAFSLIGAGEGVLVRLRSRGEAPRFVFAYRLVQWVFVALLAARMIELLLHPRFA